MIIKNNRLGLIGLGFEPTTNKPVAILLPGPNEMKAEQWAKVAKHPTVERWIEEGVLEIIGDETKDVSPGVVLSKLSPRDAEKTVSETIDMGILEAWLGKEKRPRVVKALQKQIAEIKAPPVLRNRDEGGMAKEVAAEG